VTPPEVVGGWVPSPAPDDAEWTDDAPEPTPVREAVRRWVPPAAAAAALVLAALAGVVVWVRSAGSERVLDVPSRPARVVAGSPGPGLATSPGTSFPTSPPMGTASAAGPAGALASPGAASVLVVDVEGRVRRPGLVRVPAGSRVADAVRSAGGAGQGAVLGRLNLARVLADGEQVLVPGPDDPVAPAANSTAANSGAPGTAAQSAQLDLNAATQDGLDALPGVGPVLAARIVAWRTAHGRFTTVDELGEVPGIGPKALERLRPLVRV
jgi:competence protein ComEA